MIGCPHCRGVDQEDPVTSEGEASDKCEEESEAGGGARGEIEIDISSLESNSEVRMDARRQILEYVTRHTILPLLC